MDKKEHYLFRRIVQSGCQPEVQVIDPFTLETKLMLNFASNDYLNMTQHPRVIRAAIESLQDFGTGSGGAPMLSGSIKPHQDLENKIAELEGCEAALLYSSGYGANIGALTAMLRSQDVAILDALSHASLIDGAKSANKLYFKHNDMDSLEAILDKARKKFTNKLVVLDGVYSMDGDIAKLDKIVELAHNYGAWVLVDEAHATGVLGPTGGGTPEYYNIKGKVDIITGTLSKAIGCVGGFVTGNKSLIRYLESSSRPYVFSTAPFVPVSNAALEAIHVLEEEPELRMKLWENAKYFRSALEGMGFDLGMSQTAIFPLIIGDDFKVKEMTSMLHKAGIFANPVLFPAVPKHLARVRMTVTAGLEKKHLDKALNAIEQIGKELKII